MQAPTRTSNSSRKPAMYTDCTARNAYKQYQNGRWLSEEIVAKYYKRSPLITSEGVFVQRVLSMKSSWCEGFAADFFLLPNFQCRLEILDRE